MAQRESGDGSSARGGGPARRWLLRLAGIGLVFASLSGCFVIGAWLTLTRSVRVADVTVPDLVDLDRLEAGERLRELGLRPEIGGERPDPLRPAGRVLEQIPSAGSRTRPGRSVRLVVSSGTEESRFPDVVGSSLRRAQIALRQAGFTVASVASAPNREAAVGRVVSQHPGSGETGFPGQGVSLLLSSGPPLDAWVMPSLAGRDVAGARRALGNSGFGRVQTRGSPRGVVVDQWPRPGHRVTRQTGIVLTGAPVGGRQEDR